MDFTLVIAGIVVLAAVLLAVFQNKKDQKKIMNYYEQSSEKGSDISNKSLENQERIIALLEDISNKLEK